MEKESDYIKRSIELYKYLFSSSVALLLIILWKILTEINILTNIKADWILTILTFVIIVCLVFICIRSYEEWNNLIKQLK